jgi:DNA-binding NtrC family response regulator
MIHILYVDDDDMLRRSFPRLLSTYGYEVTVASSAREAIEFLEKENTFSVVVSDLEMPVMQGDDLCNVIKMAWGLPVILTSGHPSVHAVGRACKADATFDKPCRMVELHNAIQKLLESHVRSS